MNRRAELLISGRVATLAGDDGFGWAQGIAIVDGRVLAVGPMSELESLAGPDTTRWMLPSDQLVMPGITDAHLHLMTLTLAADHIDVTGLDLDAALDAVSARHRSMLDAGDDDGWLFGHGWSAHDLGSWPDAAMLERVAPGRPAELVAHDHHASWLSVAALRAAGITAATADPEGGVLRRDADGQPTGILHETAGALVESAIPEPPDSFVEQSLARVAQQLAALGLTGCHDPGELSADTQIIRGPMFYRRLAGEDRLPMRVHASVRAPQLKRAIELGLRSGASVGRYTMGWLKLFADGSLGSRSAALLAPYDDAATNPPTGGPSGMFLTSPEDLAELAARAEENGISVQIHAIGDAAARAVLDVFESLRPQPRGLPLMRRMEHAQLVDPQDQPRFGGLGVAASVQPVHLRSDIPQIKLGWGERGEYAIPLRGILDGGALIPFGTDAPVEQPDPWPGIATALVRRDPADESAKPVGARQAIDLARAIRGACLDPALVAGQTDLGHLTPGARADLLIVPATGFGEHLDAAALAATRPLATLIDGQVVHRAARFDP
ncbi:MAG TPA: amidohydrolase [Candidatus Limnocylindria bacterium]|nr:amidohydrolase [Candidatus Limnocylindria bacterium]